jgi:hypothetical protein
MKTLQRIVKLVLLMTLISGVVTGCNLPQNTVALVNNAPNNSEGGIAPAKPSAWIDAPLDGMTLPLETYEIIYHASDPTGVSHVELTANDKLLAQDDKGSTPGDLLTLRYHWLPEEAGDYILRAREKNSAGAWSEFAEVRVKVIGATITPTLTPTLPTITVTVTPTTTPTPTITPTVESGLGLAVSTRSTNQFFYGGCEPGSITLTVQANQPEKVQYMYLFYKLQDTETGQFTESNGGTPMTKKGSDTWTITLNANQVKDYNKFDSAWFIYQFISQDKDKNLTRSKQIADVLLSTCGGGVVVPPVDPTLPVINPWE